MNHHIKQRDLILHHYEKYKKVESQTNESASTEINERVITSNNIQLDLFENIDSTDRLLEELKNSNQDCQTAVELQEMNTQLGALMTHLVRQLDETVHENDILKEKIKALETECKIRKIEKEGSEVHYDSRHSPDAVEANEEFAPLDLPVFDLASLDTPKP